MIFDDTSAWLIAYSSRGQFIFKAKDADNVSAERELNETDQTQTHLLL